MIPLPGSPPFALRARLLSPLADGGFLDEPDGIRFCRLMRIPRALGEEQRSISPEQLTAKRGVNA